MVIDGGYMEISHSYEASPIAGWFPSWFTRENPMKIPWWFGGTPILGNLHSSVMDRMATITGIWMLDVIDDSDGFRIWPTMIYDDL